MGLPPRSDALDVGRACEVIAVAWLLSPAVVAGGFARLAALRRGAVALAPGAARVGNKEGLTMLTLPLGGLTCH